jgi:hypothetical protein
MHQTQLFCCSRGNPTPFTNNFNTFFRVFGSDATDMRVDYSAVRANRNILRCLQLELCPHFIHAITDLVYNYLQGKGRRGLRGKQLLDDFTVLEIERESTGLLCLEEAVDLW